MIPRIIEHIGPAAPEELQEASSNLPSNGAAPDLWFINNDGKIEFIEAKYFTEMFEHFCDLIPR